MVHGLLTGFGESGGKLLAAMAVLAIVSGAARLWLGKSAASRSGASRLFDTARAHTGDDGVFHLAHSRRTDGGMLGIYIAEYSRVQDRTRAWRATRAMMLGLGTGYLVEVAAALLMVGTWIVWVWPG